VQVVLRRFALADGQQTGAWSDDVLVSYDLENGT
jgi:hypothetical protein